MALALNQTLVGVFYDAGGDLTKIVHADKNLILVTIAKPFYDALPVALNINGLANSYALNQALVAQVIAINAAIGLALQANIDATTTLLNSLLNLVDPGL